ncbi:hypothetical protein FAM18126_02873 [Lacticaseibacillus paracasei]|nr:hypothetical protein FAM18126_02873 [Lacticaseibacillus paracasei]
MTIRTSLHVCGIVIFFDRQRVPEYRLVIQKITDSG